MVDVIEKFEKVYQSGHAKEFVDFLAVFEILADFISSYFSSFEYFIKLLENELNSSSFILLKTNC